MEEIFLRRIQVHNDDSIASIITRLAKVNHCPINWLVKELIGYVKPDNTLPLTINFIKNNQLVHNISKISGLSEDVIWSSSLNKYSKEPWNITMDDLRDNRTSNGFLTINRSKFCPKCLSEGTYQRLFWHIDPLKICVKHRTILLSKCPNCGEKTSAFSVSTGECMKRNHSLLNISANLIDNVATLNNQKRIYQAINNYDTVNNPKLFNGLMACDFLHLNRFLDEMHVDTDKKNSEDNKIDFHDESYKDWPNSVHHTIINS